LFRRRRPLRRKRRRRQQGERLKRMEKMGRRAQ
jgi:hypothetical protein